MGRFTGSYISKTGKYELFRVFFGFIDIVSMACALIMTTSYFTKGRYEIGDNILRSQNFILNLLWYFMNLPFNY